MAQYAFGAGNMYVTQLIDAWGNTIATPTPLPLMVMQEGSIDLSADSKELYGQNQYAAAVARGKGKIAIKVKPARIYAGIWNALFFGQSLTSGLLAINTDNVGTAIPASTPYTVTVAPPNSGTFVADMGVIGASGSPLAKVASNPATGQYACSVAGVYTFAAADSGKMVYINYQYTVGSSSAGTAQMQTVRNLPMGYAPQFRADLGVSYQGKIVTFSIPQAVSTKMTLGFKNEDFMIPEFDFSAMDNGTGNVLTWSTSE
ncbi:hypothetical protein [Paludibacterium purpuratum]|uniref:Tail tube protein n=1 Tax=Paludibacterium purpuratum TaxID=1144873 RepID=A0A4R7BDY2_9NEIS|nr:hypothetical protein [Paludibacterium purpuratum]TDR82205.1 hypothetical protein DFP86_102319 [Paludibacterium purpuratum]